MNTYLSGFQVTTYYSPGFFLMLSSLEHTKTNVANMAKWTVDEKMTRNYFSSDSVDLSFYHSLISPLQMVRVMLLRQTTDKKRWWIRWWSFQWWRWWLWRWSRWGRKELMMIRVVKKRMTNLTEGKHMPIILTPSFVRLKITSRFLWK